ncbi:SUMF1/EgtB/PvdO family nonheme iron enzyme [Paenibacillus sp. BC26]|uniref:formylglycine-generating enzyme family protein n=1 Tax=Paenibacillus sp. BC26 TaxID=1881032 RepID=UPI0008EF5736|nr:SUMF1/EgtB/PvdO family nonheme iron enzyme [Paenibacillus sp. BC26]SFS51382.1 Formylglycine-generating enzyme, required for sulfatase activity, contains SUMF1/FGE domain [Paenibacillus sp. BC26]
MRKPVVILHMAIMVVVSACTQEKADMQEKPDRFVLVKGGAFINSTSSFYNKGMTIPSFYMSKYEVTQREWIEIMGGNPSQFKSNELPVETVSWYDAVAYCNKRSFQEGLQEYYTIDKSNKDPHNSNEHDVVKWTVTINEGANGYRLPTEAEWEYAAGGGQLSKSYAYSGSNQANEVAWNWMNAGDKILSGDWNWPAIENNHNQTKTIGTKQPNELELYDMSGNVREWCWEWYADSNVESGSYRVVKGGGWIGDVSNNAVSFRGKFEANGFGPDQGFRVIRSESPAKS